MMVVAPVEMDLVRSDDRSEEALWRGVKALPVNPDPAVRPFELDTHPLRLLVPVGHDHRESLFVRADKPEICRSVEQPVLRTREMRNSLDLRRTGQLGPHGPLCDVAVVAGPVCELPARVVAHPAEVPVTPVGDVGDARCGPQPHLVVEPRRHGRNTEASHVRHAVAVGESHAYCEDFSYSAVPDQLARIAEVADGTLPASGLPDDVVAFDRVHDGPSLGNRISERLLSVDVESRPGCRGGGERMPVIRNGDADGIQITPGKELPEVVVLRHTFPAGPGLDACARIAATPGVQVADSDDLGFRFSDKGQHVSRPLASHADTPDHDTIARGDVARAAQGPCGDEQGKADRPHCGGRGFL